MDTLNSSCYTYAPSDFSKYLNFRLEMNLVFLDSLIYLTELLPDNLELGKAIRALLFVIFFDFHTSWMKKKKNAEVNLEFSPFTGTDCKYAS